MAIPDRPTVAEPTTSFRQSTYVARARVVLERYLGD